MTLKALIRTKGMTREGAARLFGIKSRTLNAYIYGERRPSPRIAERIGRELGLTKEEIWDMFYADKTDRGA